MIKNYFLLIFLIIFLFSSCSKKQNNLSQNIARGNILVNHIGGMPDSLNFLIDYNSFSASICSMLYESLCIRDENTLEIIPKLAKRWEISDDKMVYTFYLNENARWDDGSEITSEDVIFTYNTIMDPKNLTGLFRSSLEDEFEYVKAIDKFTVQFKAKSKRWTIFDSAWSFTVLPKKHFEGKDFNKDFNLNLPPGSGPYKIKEVLPDRLIVLEKRKNYWAYSIDYYKDYYKFDEIRYKVITEDEITYEALKKGDIDLLGIGRASKWYALTTNPPEQFKKNWILLKRIWNYRPQGFQAFYFNLRREKFKDINVRKALAMLLNIDLINEKIMFNQYERLRSYFPGYFNSDKDLPLIPYNPEEARKLLQKAGWNKVDKDGVLLNDKGERFEINFPYTDQSVEKHLTIFKEDCEKVGIRLNLDLISPSIERKKVFQDYDYDMVWIAWGGTLFPGIEDLWRGKFAKEKNSNNIGGFENSEVDKLLDIYLLEFDKDKRIEIMKKIDKILTSEIPTILLWTAPYTRIAYWNKFGHPEKMIGKYSRTDGDEGIYGKWFVDSNLEKELIKAINMNKNLPNQNIEYYYDDSLKLK